MGAAHSSQSAPVVPKVSGRPSGELNNQITWPSLAETSRAADEISDNNNNNNIKLATADHSSEDVSSS
jgi:hypothetical protein